jgi:hypothetical protein
MTLRSLTVATLTVTMFLVAGCGGPGDKEKALAMAAQSCTRALADAEPGQGDSDIVDARSEAADLAAKAANLDPRWDSLVDASTAWEQGTRDLMEMTADLDSMNEITLARLGDDLSESEREIQAACRKVQAAGGRVDTMGDLGS